MASLLGRYIGLQSRVITSPVEHSSILNAVEQLAGERATSLPVDCEGIVHLEFLERTISSVPTALVSIQWANNETGVVQPIRGHESFAIREGSLHKGTT